MSYSEDEYLMLSGIQHFCFCRRQWALIHLKQQCAEMGLPISFLSRSGKFLCRTEGTTSGNVLLPYAQALLLARYIRGDLEDYPAMMRK